MKWSNRGIEFAIEVFVRGHSAGRSRTFPYEVGRVGPLWLMRDAPRKKSGNYRKEEWIAHDVDPREVDAIARQHARGRFFVCAMIAEGEPDESTRTAYKALGYSLLATEGFFVQPMKRIPRPPSPVSIKRVRTPDLAAQLGKITRTRPISNNLLRDDAPFRQYVALDGEDIVGRVRSVDSRFSGFSVKYPRRQTEPFAICTGRDSHHLMEDFAECAGILIADAKSNLIDGMVCELQHLASPAYA
jgi:hypothetical protein